MRSNWLLTGVAASAAFLGGFLAGCQTYDFEPVEPLSIGKEEVIADITARVSPPNLVLLLDKSNSMDRPEDPSLAACKTGNPSDPICGGDALCNETLCPTRLSRAREALGQFLATPDGTFPLRVALAAYPIEASCSPTPRMFIDLPTSEDRSVLATKAAEVNAYIQSIVAEVDDDPFTFLDRETAGGTPTAESLRYLRNNVTGLKDRTGGRRNFVLLLTDGLPNCNANHAPYTRADDPNNPCQCALTLASNCEPGKGAEKTGCLDDANSIGAINELYSDGVETIVVGLGADTATGLGPEALQAMGAAGRFKRECKVDADCGEGDSCNTASSACERSFYQASNGAALAEALRRISDLVANEEPCRVKFSSQPSDPSLIFVRVDGEQIPSNGGANWVFDDLGLLFKGQICERIEASTSDAPVKIKVSVIQSQ